MTLTLLGRQPLLVIVPQQLVQKVDRLIRDVSLIFRRDEFAPWFPGVSAEHVVELRVEVDIVAFKTEGLAASTNQDHATISSLCEKLIGTEDFGDLDELVRVVMSMEEWFFAEDLHVSLIFDQSSRIGAAHHACEHAPHTPHVQTIVILLEVHQ
jgi:hypothetical protein